MKRALLAAVVATLCVASSAEAATPLAIGHRGASGSRPEHTFASYDHAIELGADYIEQDLQLTSDGVLVVMHDETLNRTTRGDAANCTGRVDQHTLAQIKTCDAGAWFGDPAYNGQKVPTLEEVFQRYGKTVNYYIETKAPDTADHMEEKLLAMLDKYDLRTPSINEWQVLIQSFSAASLQKMHAIDPRLPLIFLGNPSIGQLPDVAAYANGVGPSYTGSGITAAWVAAAHALCLNVHPYTVNDPVAMQRLLDYGVDGMFTNYVDRLNALLPGGGAVGRQGALDSKAADDACHARIKGGTAAGTVGNVLSLTLGAPASFGTFTPGVALDYAATTTATVTSTAATTTLSVSEPGHLVNGAFSLPQPLQVTMTPNTWNAPVSNGVATILLKQPIAATDALRSGVYSTSLTFTLSTTAP